MYAVNAGSSGPWTSPAKKSAQLCGVPSSAGSSDDTKTVTVSPVLEVVGPPVQLSAASATRASVGVTLETGMTRATEPTADRAELVGVVADETDRSRSRSARAVAGRALEMCRRPLIAT